MTRIGIPAIQHATAISVAAPRDIRAAAASPQPPAPRSACRAPVQCCWAPGAGAPGAPTLSSGHVAIRTSACPKGVFRG
jgi:hypothetical protein